MTAFDILLPVLGLLAFTGYVTCLVRFHWATLFVTAGLVALVWQAASPDADTIMYWGLAAGLILFAMVIARQPWAKEARPSTPQPSGVKQAKRGDIVIDGTNVMYWDGTADLGTLRSVVDHLKTKGRTPFVFLDASSRHHLGNRSLDENGFARALGLKRNQIMVCPAGTEADAFILKFAREQDIPIVSNDRFGDRAKQVKGLKLIKGGIAGGRPIFEGL